MHGIEEGKEKLLVMGGYLAVRLLQDREARDAARIRVAAGNGPNKAKQKRIKRDSHRHTLERYRQIVDDTGATL